MRRVVGLIGIASAVLLACGPAATHVEPSNDTAKPRVAAAPTASAWPGAVVSAGLPSPSAGGRGAANNPSAPHLQPASTSAPAPAAQPEDVSVTLSNVDNPYTWNPSPVTVRPGDSVTWSDPYTFGCQQSPHSVTSTSSNWSVNASFYCGTAYGAPPGAQTSFTFTFRVPGTYTYKDMFSTAAGEVVVDNK